MLTSIIEKNWLLLLNVVEFGGITKAALALGMPQSHVSRRVSELERLCGARIFERTGRGLTLTTFGQYLVPKVQSLVDLSDALVEEVRCSGGEVMGDVRIGLLPSLVPLLGPRLFSDLFAEFPHLGVHLTEAASSHLEEYLGEGRLDIATLIRDDGMQRPNDVLLRRIPLYLVGKAGDPITTPQTVSFRTLDGLPLILPGEPHVLKANLEEQARSHGVSINVSVEANSIQLQHQIAAAGGGYAITAYPLETAPHLSAARIIDPSLIRSIVLATSPRRNEREGTRQALNRLVQIGPGILSIFDPSGAARQNS